MVGSRAQEESLCHESFLYNVLRQFQYYYDWNISSKPSWITVTPSSVNNGQYGETGSTACTLTMSKNTTEVERTGVVTISETTYGHTYTFTVTNVYFGFCSFYEENGILYGYCADGKSADGVIIAADYSADADHGGDECDRAEVQDSPSDIQSQGGCEALRDEQGHLLHIL